MAEKELSERESYEELANAIIVFAMQEYQIYYKKYLRDPNNSRLRGRVKEIRAFMKSDWFSALSKVDGDYILNKIETSVKEGKEFVFKQKYRIRKD